MDESNQKTLKVGVTSFPV